jgi:hypothetical protein
VALSRDGFLRIAVDGVDGAGKTHLADELARALRLFALPIIRASVDGFHNPRSAGRGLGGEPSLMHSMAALFRARCIVSSGPVQELYAFFRHLAAGLQAVAVPRMLAGAEALHAYIIVEVSIDNQVIRLFNRFGPANRRT